MYKYPFAIYPVHFGSPKQPVFLRFILESIRELLGPVSLFQRKGFAQIFPFSKIRATPYANLITDYTWFQAHLPGNMVQSQIIGISGFTGISIRRCGTSQIIETILTQVDIWISYPPVFQIDCPVMLLHSFPDFFLILGFRKKRYAYQEYEAKE